MSTVDIYRNSNGTLLAARGNPKTNPFMKEEFVRACVLDSGRHSIMPSEGVLGQHIEGKWIMELWNECPYFLKDLELVEKDVPYVFQEPSEPFSLTDEQKDHIRKRILEVRG
jgi:hypothetical protein